MPFQTAMLSKAHFTQITFEGLLSSVDAQMCF